MGLSARGLLPRCYKMATAAPVFSTVLEAGSGEQRIFSLEELCLYILEEKLSPGLCPLALPSCRTVAALSTRKLRKMNT